jgi:hypothetical protein
MTVAVFWGVALVVALAIGNIQFFSLSFQIIHLPFFMKKIKKHVYHPENTTLRQKVEAYQRQAQLSKLTPQAFAGKEQSSLSLLVPFAAAALTPFAAMAQACPGSGAGGNSTVNLGSGRFYVYVDLDNDGVNDIRLWDEPDDLFVLPQNTTQVSVVLAAGFWYAVRHTGAITTSANFRGMGQLTPNSTGNYATMEYSGGTNDQWGGTGTITGCLGVRKGTRIGFVQVGYDNNNSTTPNINGIILGSYGLAPAGVTSVTCANCNTVLPVEMRFFKGEIRQKKALLMWETLTEKNNRGFEVEKSTDGTNFFKIGWVDGQGDSYRPIAYSFEDKSMQPNQVCYYRLKQVDHDGRSEYTHMISLVLDNGGLSVYDFAPNPVAQGFTYLKFDALTEGDVNVTLFDASGKVAKTISAAYIAGSNGIRLDLAGLNAGTYYAKVESGAFTTYKPLAIH